MGVRSSMAGLDSDFRFDCVCASRYSLSASRCSKFSTGFSGDPIASCPGNQHLKIRFKHAAAAASFVGAGYAKYARSCLKTWKGILENT